MFEVEYTKIITETAKQFDLDPALVFAVIKVESNFNPYAYRYESHIDTASYGLMQILEKTARSMGFKGSVDELYDPKTNVYWGCRYLKSKINQYGTLRRGIASYNAGSPVSSIPDVPADGIIIKFKDEAPNSFVQTYVDKVMTAYSQYKINTGTALAVNQPVKQFIAGAIVFSLAMYFANKG